MAPNIMLIVLDAARRDALQPYGSTAQTPTIAALAREGNHLTHAYATSNWTLPSHASMFAGQLPRVLGLGQPPDGTPQSARAVLEGIAERLLPSVLQRAGYASHGFSANAWVSPPAGFDLGFDSFDFVASARSEALTGDGLQARLAWVAQGLRSARDDGAAEIGRRLRANIARWSGRPTFWFVNLVECHSPYLPPRPWNDLPAAGRVRAALDSQRYMSFESICRYAAGAMEVPAASMGRMHHLHNRSVSAMDAWLADVLDALSARKILNETLVIVCSDHGENFGDAGLIAHGFALNRELIHVPVVMAGPGTVTGDPVFSLADLPRTIADAAGIPDHPFRQRATADGLAVAQHDPMAPAEDPRIQAFTARWSVTPAGVTRLTAHAECVTDGATTLTVTDGVRSFSDADGNALTDVASDVDTRLSAALAAAPDPGAPAGLEAVPDAGASAAPGGAAQGGASAEELAALEQQMKLLGYM